MVSISDRAGLLHVFDLDSKKIKIERHSKRE
jgi:hypothetical protein